MDCSNTNRTPGCHLVAMPSPGRGHINPMMNVCKVIASKADVLITFVVTEEWLTFIGSAPIPPNIRFRTLPNVVPSELVRGANLPGFIEAVLTKMEAPFEHLLDRLELPVTAIIVSAYLWWAIAVGNRKNIPVALLWTMSPSMFLVSHYFDLLIQNGHFLVDLSERGGEVIDYIPGVSPTRLAELPMVRSQQLLNQRLEGFSWIPKAQCFLLTSFYELETNATDTLRAVVPFQVYPIGPSIPYETNTHNDMDYFKWLDSQPRSSVIYISLGSFLSVSSEQMDEMAAGLCDSGVRYMFIARGDTCRLQEACGEKGLILPWCDQLRVLRHSSVGGFWTHCGWNSTLEGLFAGVPMLTFPILFDQILNSKLVVDDWKIGLRVREVGTDKTVRKEEIGSIVQRFMDLDGEESKEMRRRARELSKTCQRALEKGGSSESNLNNFVQDFLGCHGL